MSVEVGHIKWKAPPRNKYKVNWDMSIDKSNGLLGLGAIVRD
jgi:hypothetical protein